MSNFFIFSIEELQYMINDIDYNIGKEKESQRYEGKLIFPRHLVTNGTLQSLCVLPRVGVNFYRLANSSNPNRTQQVTFIYLRR